MHRRGSQNEGPCARIREWHESCFPRSRWKQQLANYLFGRFRRYGCASAVVYYCRPTHWAVTQNVPMKNSANDGFRNCLGQIHCQTQKYGTSEGIVDEPLNWPLSVNNTHCADHKANHETVSKTCSNIQLGR